MPRRCNKPGYKSAEAARRAAERRTRKQGDELRVYSCTTCTKMWHITSQEERTYQGTPPPQQVDNEILKRLRLAARDRARSRLALEIPLAEVDAWHFSSMHVSAHARRASLQRLAGEGMARLDEPAGVIAWVRPSDAAIERMVHTSLARRLQMRQQDLPGGSLDIERWLAQWKTSVPDIPEPLRREAVLRLAQRGIIRVAGLGTPQASVTHVLPLHPEPPEE